MDLHLPSRFDAFSYAQIYDDPAKKEAATKFPVNTTGVFDATGLFQNSATEGKEKGLS